MPFRRSAFALAAALAALGCPSEGGVTNVLVVARVEVSPDLVQVIQGRTEQLSAVPKTASGITVTGRAITWSSTDPSIASVTSSGLVTAVREGGPVRIRAQVDGITGDAVITVLPVPIDRITVDPPEVNLLVGASQQLTARAFDASGGPLNGRSFNWQSSDHTTATVTTNGLVIAIREGGPVTITAAAEGKSAEGRVSVINRPPTRLAFLGQAPNAVAGQPITPPIQVALQDDLLTTVLGATNQVTIQLAANPGGAVLGGTRTRNAVNGVASFTDLVMDKAGSGYTFQATATGLVPAISNAFTLSASGASGGTFQTPPPAQAQSGAPLSPQPVIQLRDGSGNVVQQPGVVITATVSQAGAGSAVSSAEPGPERLAAPDDSLARATLGGSTQATTNAQGIASFTNLSISGTAGTYTLTFSAPGMTPLTSAPITLGPGTATQIAIAVQPPASAQSNAPLPVQPQVQVRDAAGNDVPQAGVQVTAALESGPAGGAVGGNTSATSNGSGRAVFSGLSLSGPAGAYTIRFSATGLGSVVSGTVQLGAGGATRLVMVNQPSASAQSSIVLVQQPSVRLVDASGNNVAQAGVAVTVTTVGGVINGTATRNTDAAGVAAFTDLAISGLAGNYVLTFGASGLTPATSNTIVLGPGPATRLGITTQPSAEAQSGVAFGTQPVVQLLDGAGNAVPQSARTVTAAIASGPAGATLSGTANVNTNSSGAAAFAGLAINGSSGTYTLQFTSSGLVSINSGNITLGAGAPTTIAANSTTSQAGTVGTAVGAPPSVRVTDASGNPVTLPVTVTFTVTAGGGSTVPASPAAVNTTSGIATLTSWTLGPLVGTNTVTATASGLAGSPVTFNATGTVGAGNLIAANSSVRPCHRYISLLQCQGGRPRARRRSPASCQARSGLTNSA